jgi:hypothetical protein
MMKITKNQILWLVLALLILIQLIPVDKTNPPVTGEITADPAVMDIIKRSCYDCHSNETHWPWYAHAAPVSFFIAHDVEEGREHLNFSTWSGYTGEKQRNLVTELLEEVEQGEMPLGMYTVLHSEAALSETDVQTLKSWAQKAFGVTGDEY